MVSIERSWSRWRAMRPGRLPIIGRPIGTGISESTRRPSGGLPRGTRRRTRRDGPRAVTDENASALSCGIDWRAQSYGAVPRSRMRGGPSWRVPARANDRSVRRPTARGDWPPGRVVPWLGGNRRVPHRGPATAPAPMARSDEPNPRGVGVVVVPVETQGERGCLHAQARRLGPIHGSRTVGVRTLGLGR